MPGQSVSGDDWAVLDAGGDVVLLGVIDGLGHGADAAAAAHRAHQVLSCNPTEPLDELITLCHRALLGTRGAAITLVRLDVAAGSLSWLGVGNVAAILIGVSATGSAAPRASGLSVGGIVGYRLPPGQQPATVPLEVGDLLVLASDGIADRHLTESGVAGPVDRIAGDLLDRYAKASDDAVVLLARYRGVRR
ncbi:serine/threonine-protein phosphatase [Skermania piniformis]|uniref:Serine/threonine-protein phosphatase n=2 Tax=Skermania pinensis TaxID=39122 RepID=A0ABX8SFC0_9ACTN|nr:serine/threonine-protein phosphatase [Skermania piniformis]